jgi:hypothetical protein
MTGHEPDKGKRQTVADTLRIKAAATCANAITAPAVSTTMTVLYSMS